MEPPLLKFSSQYHWIFVSAKFPAIFFFEKGHLKSEKWVNRPWLEDVRDFNTQVHEKLY